MAALPVGSLASGELAGGFTYRSLNSPLWWERQQDDVRTVQSRYDVEWPGSRDSRVKDKLGG